MEIKLENRPLWRDEAEANAPPATDQQREAQPRQSPDEQEKEKTEEEQQAEAAEQARLLHFTRVQQCMREILDPDLPDFEVDPELPRAERDALTLLWQARTATNELGTYAAAIQCSKWLNQALATLQPVLSLGLQPQSEELQKSFHVVQEEILELRYDIKQRIQKEAHRGGPRKKKKPEKEMGGDRSALGSIAWELAQLVKRRKKKKLPYDPGANPVVTALDELQDAALELGQIAAAIARWDERRADEGAAEKLNEAARELGESLGALLERCREGAAAGAPGSFESLAEALAPVVARAGDLEKPESAAPLAREAAELIYGCIDEAEAIVAAEAGGVAPEKKRGLLGRLFGRTKDE